MSKLSIVESLRRNAARKSQLDADKQLMTDAANVMAELLACCEDCLEGRGDWGARMSKAIRAHMP
jgi:RNA polymerase-interacting CarD/CdnL/TRCF family regulator